MKSKILLGALLALGISGLTADACFLNVRVACPNDATFSGIRVCLSNAKEGLFICAYTDSLGITGFNCTWDTYVVSVDTSTLPPGATLSPTSQKITVTDDAPPIVVFTLGGNFCSTPPPQGPCWLTGGGEIGKVVKGVGTFSFGGVVYPGCSPNAADGGNWNVVDHTTGLHFLGQQIIVDACYGVPTKSPPVNVNAIDFHGFGIVEGIGPVSFVGHAVDNHDGGAGNDLLFLTVSNGGSTPIMQIGNSSSDPAVVSTGNLQIHTSSCGN